jgi:hypothetical protein
LTEPPEDDAVDKNPVAFCFNFRGVDKAGGFFILKIQTQPPSEEAKPELIGFY